MNRFLKVILPATALLYNHAAAGTHPPISRGLDTLQIAVGRPTPDISFKHLINSTTPTAKLSDFKGKAVILDFWATWCQPCVSMLPKMSAFQKQFGGKLQVILVNNDDEKKVRNFLGQMASVSKPIDEPCELNAGDIFKMFGVVGLPQYVWIDKSGVIQAITGLDEVTESNVAALISGKPFKTTLKKDEAFWKYDYNEPMLTGVNGDPDLLEYHSVLGRYMKGAYSAHGLPTGDKFQGRRIFATNVPVPTLYMMAYGGFKYSGGIPLKQVHLEIRDTLAYGFHINQAYNKAHSGFLHCYELIVPETKKGQLFEYMKQDLDRLFPIKARLEQRMTKCIILTRSGKPNWKTKGGTSSLDQSYYWVIMKNDTFSDLPDVLNKYLQMSIYPLIDETGIKEPVDISIKAKLSDIEAIRAQLLPYGLDLVFGERMVDILVLTDH